MPVRRDVKLALIETHTTLTAVVKEISKTKPVSLQGLNQKINRGTLRYEDAETIAGVLGYKIEWVKKGAAIGGSK